MQTPTQRRFMESLLCTHEPVPPIDATPDNNYPLRILRAYRESCNYRWGDGNEWTESEMARFKAMNDKSDERAKILDLAIAILELGII